MFDTFWLIHWVLLGIFVASVITTILAGLWESRFGRPLSETGGDPTGVMFGTGIVVGVISFGLYLVLWGYRLIHLIVLGV